MAGDNRRRRQEGGRSNRVNLRLSDHELELITSRAEQLGVTVPRLLIESALAGNARTATERRALVAELLGARRLVAAIGNNLNQIARIANSTGRVPAEVAATAEAARRLLGRLEDAASSLVAS